MPAAHITRGHTAIAILEARPSASTRRHGFKAFRAVVYFFIFFLPPLAGSLPSAATTPFLELYVTLERTKEELNKFILEEPVEGMPLVAAVLFTPGRVPEDSEADAGAEAEAEAAEEEEAEAEAEAEVWAEGEGHGTTVTLRISYMLPSESARPWVCCSPCWAPRIAPGACVGRGRGTSPTNSPLLPDRAPPRRRAQRCSTSLPARWRYTATWIASCRAACPR
jgi:hypothetical protein